MVSPTAESGMLERMYSGVPGPWIVFRLAMLFVGTYLTARALPAPPPFPRRDLETRVPQPGATVAWLALGIAAIYAATCLLIMPVLGRWGQAAFVAGLFLPALLLWRSERAEMPRGAAWRPDGRLLAIVLAWGVWRVWEVNENPNVASPVDTWLNHIYLQIAIDDGTNLLTTQTQPAITNVQMLFMGADLLHPGQILGLTALQATGIFWAALGALASHRAIAYFVSPQSAWVATAATLSAPFALALTGYPFPWGLLLAPVGILTALLVEIHRRQSAAALVLFATVAGLGATQGYISFSIPPAVIAAAWLTAHSPAISKRERVTALLCLFGAFAPFLASFEISHVLREISGEHWDWNAVTSVAFDQRGPLDTPNMYEIPRIGRATRLDIAVSGLLAPFAVARNPLRLWGDCLLDPWSAALLAIGIALSIRFARQRRELLFCSVWLLIAQLPVILTTNYDRITPLRNMDLSVLLAPLVASAFEALRSARRWSTLGSTQLTGLVAVLAAASGLYIYEFVNPRILSASSLELVLEATQDNAPPGGTALLHLSEFEYSQIPYIVGHFPRTPLNPVRYKNRNQLLKEHTSEPIGDIILWSPALEEQCHISRAICGQFPDATIYTMRSRSGLSRAFAAKHRIDLSWSPAMPQARWAAQPCGKFVDPYPGPAIDQVCSPEFTTEEVMFHRRQDWEVMMGYETPTPEPYPGSR